MHRRTAEARDAVEIVADRKDARVVGETEIDQHVERPQGAVDDRVAGSAKSGDAVSDDVFQHAARTQDVVAEGLAAELVHEAVGEPVTGDLVAAALDVADQLRPTFRHPAEDEEGRADAAFIQQVQHAPGVRFHPMRHRVPLRRRNHTVHRVGMVVVLYVDRKCVDHVDRAGWLARRIMLRSVRSMIAISIRTQA
jgi:hypothetical protein